MNRHLIGTGRQCLVSLNTWNIKFQGPQSKCQSGNSFKTHICSENINIFLLVVAATSSDTISCLLHGSPSQSTFPVPEKWGKGGDARELLRQEMPGAAWDNGRQGGAGHTLTGTGWLTPLNTCGYSPGCGKGHINSSLTTGHPWYDVYERDAKHSQMEFKSGASCVKIC